MASAAGGGLALGDGALGRLKSANLNRPPERNPADFRSCSCQKRPWHRGEQVEPPPAGFSAGASASLGQGRRAHQETPVAASPPAGTASPAKRPARPATAVVASTSTLDAEAADQWKHLRDGQPCAATAARSRQRRPEARTSMVCASAARSMMKRKRAEGIFAKRAVERNLPLGSAP